MLILKLCIVVMDVLYIPLVYAVLIVSVSYNIILVSSAHSMGI